MGMFDPDEWVDIENTLPYKESEQKLIELLRIGNAYNLPLEGLADYLMRNGVRILK